jgi:hypothetical protein
MKIKFISENLLNEYEVAYKKLAKWYSPPN